MVMAWGLRIVKIIPSDSRMQYNNYQIPVTFFINKQTNKSQISYGIQSTLNSQNNTEENKTVGYLTIPDFKLCHKATVIRYFTGIKRDLKTISHNRE